MDSPNLLGPGDRKVVLVADVTEFIEALVAPFGRERRFSGWEFSGSSARDVLTDLEISLSFLIRLTRTLN